MSAHSHFRRPWLHSVLQLPALLIAALPCLSQAEVVISELMYHPSSENPAEEYIELYNTGAQPVAIGGNFLTNQLTNQNKQLIPPLGFIGGSGAARWQNWIANSAADATLDGEQDGANNLLEFAFNLNPQLSDIAASTVTSGLPTAQLVTVPGGQSLEVTFLRRKPPGGSTLTYAAQFSSDLTAWSAGLAPTITSVDAEWERIVVRDSAPAASGRRCVRVTVTTVQP